MFCVFEYYILCVRVFMIWGARDLITQLLQGTCKILYHVARQKRNDDCLRIFLCLPFWTSTFCRFTFKVSLDIEEASTEIVAFGTPHAKKKDAAENAAEGAIWYLKNAGYLREWNWGYSWPISEREQKNNCPCIGWHGVVGNNANREESEPQVYVFKWHICQLWTILCPCCGV